MSKVKLSTPVYDLEGNVTTCAALLNAGKAQVSKTKNFYKRRGGTRVAYFCDLLDDQGKIAGSFEISAYAYQSRKERQYESISS